jgi:hypothetical protein
MLSIPIGYMKFLFPKLFVTIFGLILVLFGYPIQLGYQYV